MTEKTISQAINQYLSSVKRSRSEETARTYKKGLDRFKEFLLTKNVNPDKLPINRINELVAEGFIESLKDYQVNTEEIYVTALVGLLKYCAAHDLVKINFQRLEYIVKHNTRTQGQRIPYFDQTDIEKLISEIEKNTSTDLISLRDRAFLISLADTGLRVHEACNLLRGSIDWTNQKTIIIGKGDKQAVVRFSNRSITYIKEYLSHRSSLDGGSGRPLASLPLFARHDKGAGKKIKPITTTTGRNIVEEWVEKILGTEKVGTITPHTFRHYFVTKVLRATNNLKKAQEAARHVNIQVTQGYTHLTDEELDITYYGIFNLPKIEDVTETSLGSIVKITQENISGLYEVTLSKYIGEKCVFCEHVFRNVKDIIDRNLIKLDDGQYACERCYEYNKT